MKKKFLANYPPDLAWVDEKGALHLDIAVILKHCRLEDTPINRAMMTALVAKTIRDQCPDSEIIPQP